MLSSVGAVDTTAPTVSGVGTTATADSRYKAAGTVPITVTFSEAVNVTTTGGTPQLTLNEGAGVVASYTSGSGTATLTFTYTVAAGQNTSALDYGSTGALALNGGTIKDLAGNTAVLTLPTAGSSGDSLVTKGLVIDTTAPSSTIALPADGGSYNPTNWPAISGTAADNSGGSGLSQVQVSIEQNSTGKFWDGSGFNATTEDYLNVTTGTATWSYTALTTAGLTSSGSYTVHSKATDLALNVQTTPASATFTYTASTATDPIVGLSQVGVSNVTLGRRGTSLLLVSDSSGTAIDTWTLASLNSVTIVSANGQNDQVTIDFASGGSFALPGGLSIQGNSAPGSNTLVLRGTNGGDTFTVNGGTITADGLTTTLTNADVQQITIVGGSGNDKYQLPASRANVSITDAGAVNSLGFSGISGTSGMTLSLASRSAQAIAAWGSASWGNKTLTLGGSLGAAGSTTIVHCGNVNSTITGGSGNNILVGGGGQNILTGGPARNLLIGGSGKSTLRGKGQDNILVSGTTNDDTNDQALLSILNEGSRQAMLNNIMLAALATRLHSPAILNQGLVTTSSGAGNSLTCGPGKNLCFLGSQDTYHAK